MNQPVHRLAAYLLAGVTLAWAPAHGFELSGFVSAEARLYPSRPAFAGQGRHKIWTSLAFQPEFRTEWNDGDDRLAFVPFVRFDASDSERTHLDVRELNWLRIADDWDLRVGIGKVFWGVAESRHLVDIINQTDFVENIDTEDKLGQPMVNLNLLRDWGTVSLFVLPGFRESTFPGVEGRLRTPVPVDTDNAEYGSSAGQWHVDLAARWSHVIGDWDIGVAHFWGTGRAPRLLPRANAQGVVDRLVPRYDIINQTSIDLQATKGAWLWKLEAITRAGHGDRFAALVAGFEYTAYGVTDTGADLGLLAEYLYDGRDDAPRAPVTISQNDLFLGARLALNDVQDTSVLAGVSFDLDDGSRFFNVEASRRLGDRFVMALEARFFDNVSPRNASSAFRRDDYILLELSRYF